MGLRLDKSKVPVYYDQEDWDAIRTFFGLDPEQSWFLFRQDFYSRINEVYQTVFVFYSKNPEAYRGLHPKPQDVIARIKWILNGY